MVKSSTTPKDLRVKRIGRTCPQPTLEKVVDVIPARMASIDTHLPHSKLSGFFKKSVSNFLGRAWKIKQRSFSMNTIIKQPFEYVDREVDKLYDKKLDGPLEDHIAFIATFIRACGWDEQDFQDVKYGVTQKYRNLNAN
jgi:hypothetical protein